MSKNTFNNTGKKHIIHFTDLPVVFMFIYACDTFGLIDGSKRKYSSFRLSRKTTNYLLIANNEQPCTDNNINNFCCDEIYTLELHTLFYLEQIKK